MKKNEAEGLAMWKLAAAQGMPVAMYNIGNACACGMGTPEDQVCTRVRTGVCARAWCATVPQSGRRTDGASPWQCHRQQPPL